MKTAHISTLAAAITLASVCASPALATEYLFYDDTITLSSSSGDTAWSGAFQLALYGKFTDGFTADASNVHLWQDNWITVASEATANGYYDPSGPEWNASLGLLDNSLYTPGETLYLWFFDSLDISTGAEWALFTDASWQIDINVDSTVVFHEYFFTEETQAIVGFFDYGAGQAATAAVSPIPEPSTWVAMAGAVTLAGSWLLRRYRTGRRFL
ncbi:hypothetical protein OPIT5_20260 [Opitutaceae bacterium TAV5]|nr:hypothetical protein OPIT5_20260 [Opitutaceae bacterium TAV5]